MKTAKITFHLLKSVCNSRNDGKCLHIEQPIPFKSTYYGPIGACTQGRCPEWKRLARCQQKREAKK